MSAITEKETAAAVRCAVFKIDLKGNLIYIDEETEELSGYSREELFGRSIYDFVPADSRHLMDAVLHRPRRHDQVYQAWPLVMRAAGNKRREYRAIVTLNFIGEAPANYQFILMPREAVPAKKTLRPRRRKTTPPSPAANLSFLGQIGDALQIGIALVDGSHAFLYANDCLVRTLTPEGGVFAQDLKALWETIKPVYLTGEPVAYADCDIIKAIDERRFTACHGRSQATGALMTMVTAPTDMISPGSSVIFCLGESILGGAAESHTAAARRLIGIMAHDLRAPLITMEAFSRRLSSDHGGRLDAAGRFALSCLTENVQIMRRMIDSLGQLAATWAVTGLAESIDVETMIDDIVTILKATYPQKKYVVDLPADLPVITAPKAKLQLVFHNLLDNAFKYSAGAVIPRIAVTYRYDDGWHRFTVGDNGPGVESQYRIKIFEPFFRTPEASVGGIPGTGMGLAIVRDIIADWGGFIRCESTPEALSLFVFAVPAEPGGGK